MNKRALIIGVVVVVCITAICIIVIGRNTNPPYTLESGENVALAGGSGSFSCSYEDLLSWVEGSLDSVLPHTKLESSGIDAMVTLHNKLENMGIKTALVAINVEDNKPLYTCIAVETTDQGLVFLTLVPESLGTDLSCDRSEYVQAVYLEKGERIGFVEAELALATSYSWYLGYLTEFYDAADLELYLQEFAEVLEENAQRLGEIEGTNEKIREYLEDLSYYTEARRVAFNNRIDRYNSYVEVFNDQVTAYNADWDEAEMLWEGLSDFIFYVREDYSYPFAPIPIPTIPIPSIVIPVPPPIAVPVPTPSSYVDVLIASDDSYDHISSPDWQSIDRFERVTDESFTVTDFVLWW